jgi:hypothetical protein
MTMRTQGNTIRNVENKFRKILSWLNVMWMNSPFRKTFLTSILVSLKNSFSPFLPFSRTTNKSFFFGSSVSPIPVINTRGFFSHCLTPFKGIFLSLTRRPVRIIFMACLCVFVYTGVLFSQTFIPRNTSLMGNTLFLSGSNGMFRTFFHRVDCKQGGEFGETLSEATPSQVLLLCNNSMNEHKRKGVETRLEITAISTARESEEIVRTSGRPEEVKEKCLNDNKSVYYANISIFRHEELKNSGKAQIINLLKAKTQVAEKTLSDTLGTDIFGANSSGIALDGLGIICAASTTECGGLSSTDITTWAPVRDTTSTVMSISALQSLYGDLTNDNEAPSVIITTQDNFDRYYNILSAMHRFVDIKTADGGFQSLTFNGKPILVDSHCTANYVYMLNEKYLDLVIHSDENFRFEPFIKPTNQNVKVAKVYFAGNLVTSQRRQQGVATSIAA